MITAVLVVYIEMKTFFTILQPQIALDHTTECLMWCDLSKMSINRPLLFFTLISFYGS